MEEEAELIDLISDEVLEYHPEWGLLSETVAENILKAIRKDYEIVRKPLLRRIEEHEKRKRIKKDDGVGG